MQTVTLNIHFDDETEETGIVYTDAYLNDEKVTFVFDTGCRRSSLCSSKFSEKLERIDEEESSGAFGKSTYDLVKVDKFILESLEKKDLIFAKAREKKIDKNLLGMDILSEYSIFFSINEKKVIFDPDTLTKEKLEPIFPESGVLGRQPYIDIKCENIKVRALWDTGAGITIADISFIKQNPELFELSGETEGTDSTGTKMTTPTYQIKSLHIAGNTFKPHTIAAVDMSHVNSKSGRSPIHIVLGFNAIKQANWYFDFKNNLWGISKFIGLNAK